MSQTFFQEKFNNSIVTALLFNNLSLCEKERKLQQFTNESEERYDMFCDNINCLLDNKDENSDLNTLYLTIDGFSFLSNFSMEHQPSCFPVLTINRYSPNAPDISMYIEIALNHFAFYCEFTKSTIRAFEESA